MFFVGLPVAFGVLCLLLRVSGSAFPPPLEKDKEKECFERMKSGDTEARRLLIEHNLRLVAHIIKKYYHPGCDNDDLLSIGTIGLIKAIDSYNPDSGTKFATYAGKCMQNEILMYFRSRKKLGMETSLSDTVETDKDGNPLTYMDLIATDDDIVEQIDKKIKTDKLRYAVEHLLTDREKRIIALRYGLYDTKPITQREAAQVLGISRSYVSRIEKSALIKLKKAFE